MKDFADLIVRLLNGEGSPIAFAVFLLVVIFFHLPSIYNLFFNRRKYRLETITQALKDGQVSDNTKEFFEQRLGIEYFLAVTGVKVTNEFREKFLELYLSCDESINFLHFKRTVKFMRLVEGEIVFKFGYRSLLSVLYDLVAFIFFVYCFCFFIFSSIYWSRR